MGNRAVITKHPYNPDDIGIYVHWNGGIESVTGFLRAAKELGFRDVVQDDQYALARLTQLIANFFGGTLSIGIGVNKNLDTTSDNGVYTIGEDWTIISNIGRSYRAQSLILNEEQDTLANQIAEECIKQMAETEKV